MNTFVIGFYGEGEIDYRFLSPLLTRVIEQLLPDDEILVFDLKVPDGLSQLEKMQHVASEGQGYNVILFHLDADDSDTKVAYQERFSQPYQILKQSDSNTDLIPVIPVRMTEAWMLADFEAFKKITHAKLTAHELGFPAKSAEVEKIFDPKNIFRQAIKQSNRRAFDNEIYNQLAISITLSRLDGIPAYEEFKDRLITFLEQEHYL